MKHVKSKRLTMFPMTIDEMNDLIANTSDAALKECYISLRDNTANNMGEYKWNCIWKICTKEDGTLIGEFHFNGLNNSTTQMGYQIFEKYWGQGYTYEVLEAMVSYALSQDEVYFMEMEVFDNDEYKISALEKMKFKIVARKDNKLLYALEKPKSRLLIIFASIGLCIGIAIGIGLSNVAIGAGVGICLGGLIGATIDKNDEDKRRDCQEARIKQGEEEKPEEAKEE